MSFNGLEVFENFRVTFTNRLTVSCGMAMSVGTPEDIAANSDSHTGRYLVRLLFTSLKKAVAQ